MKPTVERAVTDRLAASLALTLGLLATPTVAGDRALIEYLGYSADGRYFAFEEFGIQDGSGFPFATIYVVDLPADKWVPGTPYRVLLEDDGADVEDARDAALEQAEVKLDALEIDDAAYAIAVNGDGEPNANEGHELSFGDPGYGLDEVMTERTLALETFPLASDEDCESFMGEKALGFALSLDGDEFYRDKGKLPKSRGCTMGYKIYAIVKPAEWSLAASGSLVVISSYPFGFEGPDRRFLVVPLN
jgi:predicted secreted protein